MMKTQIAIQATIDRLEGLRSELERNAEADSPHIHVFRYSDELIEWMNENGVSDPNAALDELSDMIDSLLDESIALES